MAQAQRWLRGKLVVLVPSFVADYVWPERRCHYKLHPTSYLDGLRGLACLLVYVCHYTEENHAYFMPAYGLHTDALGPPALLQLPFVRLVFSGRPMVHIFFVISGFVLSYKPLRQIRARELDRCFHTLASSSFRRPLRLFAPCAVSTLVIAFMIRLGWTHPVPYPPLPPGLVTFADYWWFWVEAMYTRVAWPWEWDTEPVRPLDVHLWTIPLEFVHSMLLFLVILSLARLAPAVRMAVVGLIMYYCLATGHWAAFEFMAGMFLAEVHLTCSSPPPPPPARLPQHVPKEFGLGFASPPRGSGSVSPLLPDTPPLSSALTSSTAVASPVPSFGHLTAKLPRAPEPSVMPLSSLKAAMHVVMLVFAAFVACWPNFDQEVTPGIRLLHRITPPPFCHMDPLAPQKFWFGVCAVLVVWSANGLPLMRRLLEGSFAQYCGRVSFAVYIVHGPVLQTLQRAVVGTDFVPAEGEYGDADFQLAMAPSGLKAVTGTATSAQRTWCWLLGLLVLSPLVVWVADVFWRLVDNPCVVLARRLETWSLDDEVRVESQRID